MGRRHRSGQAMLELGLYIAFVVLILLCIIAYTQWHLTTFYTNTAQTVSGGTPTPTYVGVGSISTATPPATPTPLPTATPNTTPLSFPPQVFLRQPAPAGAGTPVPPSITVPPGPTYEIIADYVDSQGYKQLSDLDLLCNSTLDINNSAMYVRYDTASRTFAIYDSDQTGTWLDLQSPATSVSSKYATLTNQSYVEFPDANTVRAHFFIKIGNWRENNVAPYLFASDALGRDSGWVKQNLTFNVR